MPQRLKLRRLDGNRCVCTSTNGVQATTSSTRASRSTGSEGQARAEPQVPLSGPCGRGDDAEGAGIGNIPSGIGEVRVIQKVQRLESELQPGPLRKRDGFERAEVHVEE